MKVLIVLTLVVLGSIQSSAMDLGTMECTAFPLWYTFNSADNSVSQTLPTDNKKVEIPLSGDPKELGSHTGKMEYPVGDSGEFRVVILAQLARESDSKADSISVNTTLLQKDKQGTFNSVSSDRQQAIAGDEKNSFLAEIYTEHAVENTEFKKAEVAYGISMDEINLGLSDEHYIEMVKKNLIAPKTLSNIHINCVLPKLRM